MQIIFYGGKLCEELPHSGRWSENNNFFLGEYKVITKKQQFLGMYNFMFFYVFKMTVAIAFLCKNAVLAV